MRANEKRSSQKKVFYYDVGGFNDVSRKTIKHLNAKHLAARVMENNKLDFTAFRTVPFNTTSYEEALKAELVRCPKNNVSFSLTSSRHLSKLCFHSHIDRGHTRLAFHVT